MVEVTNEQLEALRSLDTCTVANAIETYNIRPRNQGFMSPKVRCIFPDIGRMIGFAVTGVIAAYHPATPHMDFPRTKWFDEVLKIRGPRVVVLHDLDYPEPAGSFWGEVQSNIHTALGCVGTVTDGGVRDLDEMHGLGFHAFAGEVLVSHAYVHLVEASIPVKVGGLVVKPGDILLGDKHGIISIPPEIAGEIPAAAAKVAERERRIINLCQSPDFELEKLKKLVSG